MINLERYRVFYYTAKELSFSKAAQELFISQPAVSQAIKQLETDLGGQLFFRNSRGVKLTNEGEVLFKYIEQAYQLILTAETKLMNMQSLLSGEIKIGASDTLSKYYLLPFLKDFHERYPGIQMRVANLTTPETVQALKIGDLDLGIINLPLHDNQLVIQKAVLIQDCFAVGERYKVLTKKRISIHQLVKYPFLLLEKGTNTRKFVDELMARFNLNLAPEIELGSIDNLVQFTKSGLGISYLVKDFIQDELSKSELYELRIKEKIPTRAIGIATLKNIPLSRAAAAFIELLDPCSSTEIK